jgi:hypothetical protein
VATKFALPGYSVLNHSEGHVGWMRQISKSGIRRQKKEKPWYFVHLLVDGVEKKKQKDFLACRTITPIPGKADTDSIVLHHLAWGPPSA